MLKTLQLQHFKCFENITVDFGKITLLSGINSSGKSSAIQGLLLIDNTLKNYNRRLNNDWLNLGTFEETRNFITRTDKFSITAHSDDDNTINLTYSEDTENIKEAGIIGVSGFEMPELYYLSAHRIGPQNSYSKNFNPSNIIGEKGEFVFDLLNKYKSNLVQQNRIADNVSYTLEYQVNFWLQKITRVKIDVEDLGITNLVSANYTFNRNTRKVRPYHIGAGISYLIGILVLGLYVNEGSILIIENPEIHLHPKAQSDLADFLCFIANAGVQVIIESHSDHIFNGIRKSVFRKTISNNDAKIHFFKMNENNLSENHLIKLSENGKILNYQEGLFDQFDNDLDELLGL